MAQHFHNGATMKQPARKGRPPTPGAPSLKITRTLPPRRERVGTVTHLKERILRETTIVGLAEKLQKRPEWVLDIVSVDATRIDVEDYNLICKAMGWNPIAIMAVEIADAP